MNVAREGVHLTEKGIAGLGIPQPGRPSKSILLHILDGTVDIRKFYARLRNAYTVDYRNDRRPAKIPYEVEKWMQSV